MAPGMYFFSFKEEMGNLLCTIGFSDFCDQEKGLKKLENVDRSDDKEDTISEAETEDSVVEPEEKGRCEVSYGGCQRKHQKGESIFWRFFDGDSSIDTGAAGQDRCKQLAKDDPLRDYRWLDRNWKEVGISATDIPECKCDKLIKKYKGNKQFRWTGSKKCVSADIGSSNIKDDYIRTFIRNA